MAIRSRTSGGEGGSSPLTSSSKKMKLISKKKGTPDKALEEEKKFIVSGELKDVINEINSEHKYSIIRKASAKPIHFGRVPTGILALDLGLAGGIMLSRACLIYGERSAGKSTLALIIIASIQKLFPYKAVIYLDIEGTLDRTWAAKLGCDLERLLIFEPETGEQAVDYADAVLRTNEVSMIVTDSIAFLTPHKEIEESAATSMMGVHARLIGNYIRRLNNGLLVERHKGHVPVVMHLNQFRMKLGLSFGDPRTLPGGKALEFSTSQQMLISNKEHKVTNPSKDIIVSFNEHTINISKDKTGGRIREAKFKIVRDPKTNSGLPEGFVDQGKTIIAVARRIGLITGGGTKWHLDKYGDFGSTEKIIEVLNKDYEIRTDIITRIVNKYREEWGIET